MDLHIWAVQCTVYSVYSLNLVGQNAVESSTIVVILFAFIPNKYNLLSKLNKDYIDIYIKEEYNMFY